MTDAVALGLDPSWAPRGYPPHGHAGASRCSPSLPSSWGIYKGYGLLNSIRVGSTPLPAFQVRGIGRKYWVGRIPSLFLRLERQGKEASPAQCCLWPLCTYKVIASCMLQSMTDEHICVDWPWAIQGLNRMNWKKYGSSPTHRAPLFLGRSSIIWSQVRCFRPFSHEAIFQCS